MKIAFVVSDVSFPPVEGLHEQTARLLEGLVHNGHSVDLHGFVKSGSFEEVDELLNSLSLGRGSITRYSGSTVLQGLCNRVGVNRASRRLRAALDELVGSSPGTAVVLEGAAAAGMYRRRYGSRTVVSWIDPGSRRNLRFARAASSLRRKASYLLAAVGFYSLELSCAFSGSTWHVVSEIDRVYLARVFGCRQDVVSIPVLAARGGIEGREGREGREIRGEVANVASKVDVIVFADLRQSHLSHSTRNVLALLARRSTHTPICRFRVLGRVTFDPLLAELEHVVDLEYIPWVADLERELADADLVLLPDGVGTGIKNRAISALGAGACVIASEVALEGLAVTPGVHALKCATDDEWVVEFDRAVGSSDLRASLKANSVGAVVDYQPRSVLSQWEAILRRVANR